MKHFPITKSDYRRYHARATSFGGRLFHACMRQTLGLALRIFTRTQIRGLHHLRYRESICVVSDHFSQWDYWILQAHTDRRLRPRGPIEGSERFVTRCLTRNTPCAKRHSTCTSSEESTKKEPGDLRPVLLLT